MTRNIKGKHMFRTLLGGKIHRATVTEADLNYVGSITIDPDLMDAAGICVNEKVAIVNNNNGRPPTQSRTGGRAQQNPRHHPLRTAAHRPLNQTPQAV